MVDPVLSLEGTRRIKNGSLYLGKIPASVVESQSTVEIDILVLERLVMHIVPTKRDNPEGPAEPNDDNGSASITNTQGGRRSWAGLGWAGQRAKGGI